MPATSSIPCLVVDDQQTMRSLVRTGLQQLGFRTIHEAPDGEEGLRHMLSRPVQLVISDYNMPKLDGLGLLRAIRSHPPIQKTAFIMLTGRADKELVQRAVQFGVNNYLVKPFTVGTLKEKIEAIFGVLT
ncbi:MAG: response regulator [Alphaproteobacteria bacterium]|jgi:two-component system chemotaxis response regulator CheY|nr:response regulator [Alphaproteobacteria bacterium]MBU1515839.1 response regulator [Alphaproteobacteria bacterium]MBU2094061.1 response regulator [Alphaproteobacteria bacterium]MBU2151413.1 response regulator [Alphaproteobacteria bacterium]MBU2305311.1 response regulator [Alphaproteobacteria bacterium]